MMAFGENRAAQCDCTAEQEAPQVIPGLVLKDWAQRAEVGEKEIGLFRLSLQQCLVY